MGIKLLKRLHLGWYLVSLYALGVWKLLESLRGMPSSALEAKSVALTFLLYPWSEVLREFLPASTQADWLASGLIYAAPNAIILFLLGCWLYRPGVSR